MVQLTSGERSLLQNEITKLKGDINLRWSKLENASLMASNLRIKEKRLLFVEQPSSNLGKSPIRSGNGIPFEPLLEMAGFLLRLKSKK